MPDHDINLQPAFFPCLDQHIDFPEVRHYREEARYRRQAARDLRADGERRIADDIDRDAARLETVARMIESHDAARAAAATRE